ncbi:hypothetical protein GA0111570_11816, partial [Raineyella antarctica]
MAFNLFRKNDTETVENTFVPASSPLNDLEGTYTLDASHTTIGFVARHAMVT